MKEQKRFGCTRVKRNINTLEYPLWFPSSSMARQGFYGTSKYSISTSAKSLPTSSDIDILNCLLAKAQSQKSDTAEHPSMWALAKELGYSECGATYDRLYGSLFRWSEVSIRYMNNSFYDGGTKKYKSMAPFGVVKSVHLSVPLVVEFDACFMDVNRDKYSVELPAKQFQRVRMPYAKRLFEILYKSFRSELQSCFPINMKKLAKKVPFSHDIRPSDMEKTVRKSVDEINKVLKSSKSPMEFSIEKGKNATFLFFQHNVGYLTSPDGSEDEDDQTHDDMAIDPAGIDIVRKFALPEGKFAMILRESLQDYRGKVCEITG